MNINICALDIFKFCIWIVSVSAVTYPIVELDSSNNVIFNITLSDNRNCSVYASKVGSLISSNYKEIIYSNSETYQNNNNLVDYMNNGAFNSHWRGTVEFSDGSIGFTAFSTCLIKQTCLTYDLDGSIQFFKGIVHDDTNGIEYMIEPVILDDPNLSFSSNNTKTLLEHTITLKENHRMLQEHNHTEENDTSCGGGLIPDDGLFTSPVPFEILIDEAENVEIEDKYILFHVTNDKQRVDDLGIEGASDETFDLINTINAFYGQRGVDAGFNINITLILSEQVFFVDGNPWDGLGLVDVNENNGNVDSYGLLYEFRDWLSGYYQPGSRYNFEYESINKYHVAHLFSNNNFQSGIVGLAYVGTACYSRYNVAVDSIANQFNRGAYATAHELGHNLGMSHDGYDNTCSQNGNIMGPYVSTDLDRTWSSCSADYLNYYLSIGYLYCFSSSEPNDNGYCGDGEVNNYEECDTYGYDDDCCDGSTCMLYAGAQCSYFNNDQFCSSNCEFIKTCEITDVNDHNIYNMPELNTKTIYENEILLWNLTSDDEGYTKYRGDLNSFLFRFEDGSQSNLTRIFKLDSTLNSWKYMYVTTTMQVRNFNSNEDCSMNIVFNNTLDDHDPVMKLTYSLNEQNIFYTGNFIIDISKNENCEFTAMFQINGENKWDTCFVKGLSITAFTNNSNFIYTNLYVLNDITNIYDFSDWILITNGNGELEYSDYFSSGSMMINSGSNGESSNAILNYISDRGNYDSYYLNYTIIARSFDSNSELCILSYSRNQGRDWKQLAKIDINDEQTPFYGDKFLPYKENVINDVVFKLTMDGTGFYDYCHLVNLNLYGVTIM